MIILPLSFLLNLFILLRVIKYSRSEKGGGKKKRKKNNRSIWYGNLEWIQPWLIQSVT